MKALLTLIIMLGVLGSSLAVDLSGSSGKTILENITGNKSINESNETQSGLSGVDLRPTTSP